MFYWFVYDGLKHQIRNCIVRWECSKFHSPSCQAAKMDLFIVDKICDANRRNCHHSIRLLISVQLPHCTLAVISSSVWYSSAFSNRANFFKDGKCLLRSSIYLILKKKERNICTYLVWELSSWLVRSSVLWKFAPSTEAIKRLQTQSDGCLPNAPDIITTVIQVEPF